MIRLAVAFMLCAAVAVVWVPGCGKGKEASIEMNNAGEMAKLAQGGKATFEGENGEKVEIETEASGEKTTITNEKGEKTTVTKDVDLSKLGIEVYPGATVSNSVSVGNVQAAGQSVELETPDSFDKVAEFYKGKYKNAVTTEQTGEEGKSLSITTGSDNNMKMIMVTEDKEANVTRILLHNMAEMKNE